MSGALGTAVVVGSVNVDQVVAVARHPRPGETLIGTGVEQLPGGKGANQAVAAARRGAATAMVGSVGRGLAAEVATGLLADSGVDLTHLHAVDAPTGFAAVTVDDDGENTIVVVPGANSATGAAAVAAAARAAVVVLQGEIPADGITAAADTATGRVVLNFAPVVPLPRRVVVAADPLVVNEHEAALVLAQLDGGGATAAREAADESDLVRSLLGHGVRSVVVTLGARGALGGAQLDGTVALTAVPSPRAHAVDSSGAGDAFVGALAASLATGCTLIDAVHRAVRVGVYAVQHVGTQPSYPTLDDTLPGAVATEPTRGNA